MVAPMVKVNDVAADRAVTTGFSRVESVVLQVTPSLVPKLSSTVSRIMLFAVTAVVFTWRVGLVPVGSATVPAAADAHTAGDALLEQLFAVRMVFPETLVENCPVVKDPAPGVVPPMVPGTAQVWPSN
jgi:hypothetical protein